MKFGKLMNEIRDALKETFPASLKDQFKLAIRDAHLTDSKRVYTYDDFTEGTQDYEMVIQKVIDWAESADSLVSLLNAAVNRRPKSKELRNLADRVRPLQEEFEFLGADLGEVEKIVLRDVKFEDVLTWVPRLIQTRDAVCRFEPQPPKTPDQPGPDAGFGSGFLVGPDVVMTADHNVVKYWGDQHAARQIVLRFDCYKRPDGTVTPG